MQRWLVHGGIALYFGFAHRLTCFMRLLVPSRSAKRHRIDLNTPHEVQVTIPTTTTTASEPSRGALTLA
jgi:hypothetical protein